MTGGQPDRLRVGTYNLAGPAPARAAEQVEMLREYDLDLLALQEAQGPGWLGGDDGWCGVGPRLAEFAGALGMEGLTSRSRADDRHTAVLWRGDRLRRIGGRDYSHVAWRTLMVHVFAWAGDGNEAAALSVLNVHGHHANAQIRYAEAQHAARTVSYAARAVVVGDHNSVHGVPRGVEGCGEEDVAPDLRMLPPDVRASQILYTPEGDPLVDATGRWQWDRRPSKILQVAGFRDAEAQLRAPTERAERTGAFLHPDAPRRLDRIYTAGALRAVEVVTVEDRQARFSDHYAVIAELQVL